MPENKIELELLGITYNQIESGVYAVILRQKGGSRRIPIIIGSAEAQSIECKLQDVVTPRPLTHDLMVNMMRDFGLSLSEVQLRRLQSGIFAAYLVVTDGERELHIDSRSSDAIALAVRIGCPIYTSEEVLREAGFDADKVPMDKPGRNVSITRARRNLSDLSVEELETAMTKAVESENYEEAARIKKELDSRAAL